MRSAAVVAVLCLASWSAALEAEEIWVFTAANAATMQDMDSADRVWVLGDIDAPFRGLRFDDPGDAVAARRLAAARIQSPAGQAAIEEVKGFGAAMVMAWRYGIEKLPAVLVDRRYVVYGERSVAAAVSHIERYRSDEK